MSSDAELKRLLLKSIEPVIERQHAWINFCLNSTVADSPSCRVFDIPDFQLKGHLLSSLKDKLRDLIDASSCLALHQGSDLTQTVLIILEGSYP